MYIVMITYANNYCVHSYDMSFPFAYPPYALARLAQLQKKANINWYPAIKYIKLTPRSEILLEKLIAIQLPFIKPEGSLPGSWDLLLEAILNQLNLICTLTRISLGHAAA